jgi:hypothetical protein
MAVSPGGFVALDCADPTELGEFGANMLGGDVIVVSVDIVAVRTPWVWLTALRVDNHKPPTWPRDDVPRCTLTSPSQTSTRRQRRLCASAHAPHQTSQHPAVGECSLTPPDTPSASPTRSRST